MGLLSATLAAARPGTGRVLTDADRRIREVSGLPVRVGVVGVEPGCGTSTVAGLMVRALGMRRRRVLCVDMCATGRPVTDVAGAVGVPPADLDDDPTRAGAGDVATASTGVTRTSGGVGCLDLATGGGDRWWSALGPAARFFDVTVTDWGCPGRTADPSTDRWAAAVASSTVVVIVGVADRVGLQQCVERATSLADAEVGVVLALVDVHRSRTPGLQVALDAAPWPGVLVGHDPGVETTPPTVRVSTVAAVLALTADAVGGEWQ